MTAALDNDHPATDPAGTDGVRDLRRTWRLIAAVAIALGPLMVTVLRGVMPYWTDDSQAEIVAGIAGDLDSAALMNVLGLACYPFLLLGALATAYAVRRRTPLLATVGGGILFTALALASSVGASDVLAEAMARSGDFDQATIVETTQLLMDHPTGIIGILSFVLGHLTGMVLLGIAVVRAGLVPWWAGTAIVVSQPVHVISAVVVPSRALDVVAGWGLTSVGFVVVAIAVARMHDDEWDLPPIPRG
jgi:hypothetical protein